MRANHWFLVIIIVLAYFSIPVVDSSRGDKDITFYRCMTTCRETKCTGSDYNHQPLSLRLLGWDCEGECQYSCMWETVTMFQNYNLPIPQFFGKWPFVRLAGIQEPASVLASLLNLLVHVYGIRSLRKQIPPDSPLYWFWHLFSLVCINGWIWSTVFHTRDTPLTEAMDYFSAFSMVTFSFFAAFVRMFEGKSSLISKLIPGALISSFFANHIYYLAFVKFDYGYNMKANITVGILNATCWLSWCWGRRKTHPHVWKCTLFILLALTSISLEVLDFPPILWALDSHALWHFSTAFITPIWYSFVIDDCRYLVYTTKYKIL